MTAEVEHFESTCYPLENRSGGIYPGNFGLGEYDRHYL